MGREPVVREEFGLRLSNAGDKPHLYSTGNKFPIIFFSNDNHDVAIWKLQSAPPVRAQKKSSPLRITDIPLYEQLTMF